jgi:hypothetical protein
VAPIDTEGGPALNVTLLTLRLRATGKHTGNLTEHDFSYVNLPEPADVQFAWVETSLTYRLGESIVLSRADVSQVLITLASFGEECTNGMRNFFKSRGILE